MLRTGHSHPQGHQQSRSDASGCAPTRATGTHAMSCRDAHVNLIMGSEGQGCHHIPLFGEVGNSDLSSCRCSEG